MLKILYALCAVMWTLYTLALFFGYTIDTYVIATSFIIIINATFFALAFLTESEAK